jgi:YesN/AraC family two-component response regulator
LVKPFDLVQLVFKIKNLLDITEKAKNKTRLESVVQFDNKNIKTKNTLEKIDIILEEMINGSKNISIENLAKEIPTSQSTITRLIRAKYGMTTNNYIMKRKMEKAAILLSSEVGLQIKEVAGILDFKSVAYFTKCFKRYTGSLPKIARRNGNN